MDSSDERRDGRRLFLGPEHSIHFLVKGHPFRQVRITNVSLGGCFAMVGLRDQGLFAPETILEQLGFEHPDLPQGSITAQVRYAIGAQTGQPGLEFMGIGIGFTTMPPEAREGLAAFLAASLGA